MGGSITVAIRFPDKSIDCKVVHTECLSFCQPRIITEGEAFWRNYFNDCGYVSDDRDCPIAPVGYGLTVVDLMNNHISSMQDYCFYDRIPMNAATQDDGSSKRVVSIYHCTKEEWMNQCKIDPPVSRWSYLQCVVRLYQMKRLGIYQGDLDTWIGVSDLEELAKAYDHLEESEWERRRRQFLAAIWRSHRSERNPPYGMSYKIDVGFTYASFDDTASGMSAFKKALRQAKFGINNYHWKKFL